MWLKLLGLKLIRVSKRGHRSQWGRSEIDPFTFTATTAVNLSVVRAVNVHGLWETVGIPTSKMKPQWITNYPVSIQLVAFPPWLCIAITFWAYRCKSLRWLLCAYLMSCIVEILIHLKLYPEWFVQITSFKFNENELKSSYRNRIYHLKNMTVRQQTYYRQMDRLVDRQKGWQMDRQTDSFQYTPHNEIRVGVGRTISKQNISFEVATSQRHHYPPRLKPCALWAGFRSGWCWISQG